jgi:cytochrome b6-f complex iron-sulfur subunit
VRLLPRAKFQSNTTGFFFRGEDAMERKEFLSIIGFGAAAVACGYCLGGCNPNPGGSITAPTNVDFTLDLTNPAYSGLKTIGNYVYNAGVIVAHSQSGYVAVSLACTHQGATVVFDASTNSFFCPAHGSRFSLNGGVTVGPAGSPLGTYKTTLTGNSLRVYS